MKRDPQASDVLRTALVAQDKPANAELPVEARRIRKSELSHAIDGHACSCAPAKAIPHPCCLKSLAADGSTRRFDAARGVAPRHGEARLQDPWRSRRSDRSLALLGQPVGTGQGRRA